MGLKTLSQRIKNPLCVHRWHTTRTVLATGSKARIPNAPTHRVRHRRCKLCNSTKVVQDR